MKGNRSEDTLTVKRQTAYTLFSTSIPTARRAKVMTDAKPLLTAHVKCKDLWLALQLADYKKEGVLNDAAVTVMFEKEREKFCELLPINSSEELQLLLDEDEDGFLNEDEQILIFSFIKERMQSSADELCAIHEYGLYKDMMRAIRILETDIIRYQESLRKRIQDKQLSAYHEIGVEKLNKFNEDWDKKFAYFKEEAEARVKALKDTHQEQLEKLDYHLQKDNEILKIKPKAVLKELQVEEKLVAVNERFAEAQKIRNELRHLEVGEQQRIEDFVLTEQEKKRVQLLKQQERELKQLELKTQTIYNKLKIKKEMLFTRLQKENRLYVNDITKTQNLANRLARKLGASRDELRRTKDKSKTMMKFLKEAKSVPSRQKSRGGGDFPSPSKASTAGPPPHFNIPGHLSTIGSNMPTSKSTAPLKMSSRKLTRFNITSSGSAVERPVNSISTLAFNKIKRTTMTSLGSLYNDNLEPLVPANR